MIDVAMFSKHLYTRYYPDPDLLIRTSGEMRLSNFLLWQTSYTEMYVTPKLWPDFKSKIYSPQSKNSAAASGVTERWSKRQLKLPCLVGRAVLCAPLVALTGVMAHQIDVYSRALVVTNGQRHEI